MIKIFGPLALLALSWLTTPAPAQTSPVIPTPICKTEAMLLDLNKSIVVRVLHFKPDVQTKIVESLNYTGVADTVVFAFLTNGNFAYFAMNGGCYVPHSATNMTQKEFMALMASVGDPDLIPDTPA